MNRAEVMVQPSSDQLLLAVRVLEYIARYYHPNKSVFKACKQSSFSSSVGEIASFALSFFPLYQFSWRGAADSIPHSLYQLGTIFSTNKSELFSLTTQACTKPFLFVSHPLFIVSHDLAALSFKLRRKNYVSRVWSYFLSRVKSFRMQKSHFDECSRTKQHSFLEKCLQGSQVLTEYFSILENFYACLCQVLGYLQQSQALAIEPNTCLKLNWL